MNTFWNKLLLLHTDLERLFYKKEFQSLAGEKQKTILTLIFILFFTLVALGFAVGSRQNMKKKMDNPFTNWVDLPVNSSYEDSIPAVMKRYQDPQIAKAYNLDSIRGYNRYYVGFYHQRFIPGVNKESSLLYNFSGRTIESDDPLLATILDPVSGNLEWLDEAFLEEGWRPLEGCEIIITREMHKGLGYENDSIGYLLINNNPHFHLLKVIAVVNRLPNSCDFACSPKLYNILTGKKVGIDYCFDLVAQNKESDNAFRVFTSNPVDPGQMEQLAGQYFQSGSPPSFSLEQQVLSGKKTFNVYRLAFMPIDKPALRDFKAFLDAIKDDYPLAELAELECGAPKCEYLGNYHYLAFNFDRLMNIREFQQDLAENFKIEIDMSQVEAKENFALVSRLTLIISLILLGFSVLSVVLFVNNLLRNHLFEVRSNLGTFQAFGLDDHFLNRIYLKIIFSFLALSIFVALLLTIIIDRSEQLVFQQESQFNIFDSSIILSIVGLLLISLLITLRTIRQILGDTPGNLIYKR